MVVTAPRQPRAREAHVACLGPALTAASALWLPPLSHAAYRDPQNRFALKFWLTMSLSLMAIVLVMWKVGRRRCASALVLPCWAACGHPHGYAC